MKETIPLPAIICPDKKGTMKICVHLDLPICNFCVWIIPDFSSTHSALWIVLMHVVFLSENWISIFLIQYWHEQSRPHVPRYCQTFKSSSIFSLFLGSHPCIKYQVWSIGKMELFLLMKEWTFNEITDRYINDSFHIGKINGIYTFVFQSHLLSVFCWKFKGEKNVVWLRLWYFDQT